MSSLLIDFNKIVKPNNLELLKYRCLPIPVTKFKLGLILIITQNQYNILNSMPKGIKRVTYINSKVFVNDIIDFSWLVYDSEKKLCEIIDTKGELLNTVLERTLLNIPNDVILCVRISMDDPLLKILIRDYVNFGFGDPYVSKKSPVGFKFSSYGICFLRENNVVSNDSTNDVKHLLSQFPDKSFCSLKVRICNDSIKYLQTASKLGSTLNKNGVITQKEIAGRLLVKKIEDDFTHLLEVDRSSIVYGDEESVEVVEGLYNFHSHPVEAYERNLTKFTMPSAQDYLGFLHAVIRYGTILHIVSCVEGFYVLSLSPYLSRKEITIDDKLLSFVINNYNLNCKKGVDYTTSLYLSKINGIKFKGYPVFFVQYFLWESAKTTFVVSHCKNDSNNCLTRQTTFDSVKSLLK